MYNYIIYSDEEDYYTYGRQTFGKAHKHHSAKISKIEKSITLETVSSIQTPNKAKSRNQSTED